jgi:hypothetical protein
VRRFEKARLSTQQKSRYWNEQAKTFWSVSHLYAIKDPSTKAGPKTYLCTPEEERVSSLIADKTQTTPSLAPHLLIRTPPLPVLSFVFTQPQVHDVLLPHGGSAVSVTSRLTTSSASFTSLASSIGIEFASRIAGCSNFRTSIP